MEARLVNFQGRVQGVGFRARTRDVARSCSVCGYVKNLADGSVELVAEGEAAEIDRFLVALRLEMGHLIRAESARAIEPTRLEGFEVRW